MVLICTCFGPVVLLTGFWAMYCLRHLIETCLLNRCKKRVILHKSTVTNITTMVAVLKMSLRKAQYKRGYLFFGYRSINPSREEVNSIRVDADVLLPVLGEIVQHV